MNSRPPSLPFAILGLAWVAFAAYVWLTSGHLPERVATHFGANGEPNGWQTPEGYVRFTLIFGAVVPAFVLGTFGVMRLANGWGLNIAHKDYWLAPERREETFAFVQRQGVCFAGLLIAFFAGMHYAILAANERQPASLSSAILLSIVVPFLAATILWGVVMIRHFSRIPA